MTSAGPVTSTHTQGPVSRRHNFAWRPPVVTAVLPEASFWGWGAGADPEAGGEGRSEEGELSASCFSYLVPGVSVPPSSSIPL